MNSLLAVVPVAIVLCHVSPSEAQVAQCAQAYPVVNATLDAALKRLEEARQTNSASTMRAATDAVQAAIVDVRSQLAPCGQLQSEGPTGGHAGHSGHVSPSTQQAPAAPPATPAMAPGSPTLAPDAPRPGASAAPQDPHAGHAMPAPSTAKPTAAGAPPAPTPAARASTSTSGTRLSLATSLDALECDHKVDPKSAPRMLHQGRMYYFCSEQERSAFAREPTKFVTETAPAQPSHRH